MGANTKIEWCDFTFNPWRGCSKVAAGCQNCYAESQSKRNPNVLGIWGPNGTRVVASEDMWGQPEKWNRAAERDGVRRRVFCASLADVFEDWNGQVQDHKGSPLVINASETVFHVTDEYEPCYGERPYTLDDVRVRLFRLIDATPNLDWLLLTKRPENIRKMWPVMQAMRPIFPGCPGGLGEPVPCVIENANRSNVWLGASIACQTDADRNIPLLMQCHNLSPVLFVSCEPLIGSVDLSTSCINGIQWLIAGGESGHGARPCDVAWLRSIARQCQDAGIPCFVKQLGANVRDHGTTSAATFPLSQCWPDCTEVDEGDPWRIRLRDPKGGDPVEWPEDLRVREFPTV